MSDGTIIKEIVTLRAALRWAVNERWIQTAPKIEAPPSPHAKERWLTRAEVKRLLDVTGTPHVRLFIQLALYTGARTSAILELQWDQVDFERNVINYGTGSGNKKRAIVPIIPELREVLWEAATIRTRDCVIEFRGGPVASIRHAFRERVKAAGLQDVTPHTLRHTCATWMVMQGVPFEMVAKFLGNSVDMIERVYGHHSPDWLRKAATALSGFAG
nr:site-specific integrase [Acetobacter senegalensis]